MTLSDKQESIIREIELYVPIRYSLEKAILTLSAVPLLTIFSMILVNNSWNTTSEMSISLALLYLIAPLLYLFIVYHIVRLHLRIIRIKSYLGYLEDLLTSSMGNRDIYFWEREIDIEERYTFINSALQVPFHVAAFVVLMVAYCEAFQTLESRGDVLIPWISLVILILFILGLLFELLATALAHWDTKASINKDRVRNRLEPLPSYYAEVRSYFSIYPLEKKMVKQVKKERLYFGDHSKFEDLNSGSKDVKYLATEALFSFGSNEEIDKLIGEAKNRCLGKGYLAVSFRSKDTLMTFSKFDQQNNPLYSNSLYIGKASLLVPMAPGDKVRIWDPNKELKDENLVSGVMVNVENYIE